MISRTCTETYTARQLCNLDQARKWLNDGTKDPYGAIAQLGERWLCKPEVAGSIPAGSTR